MDLDEESELCIALELESAEVDGGEEGGEEGDEDGWTVGGTVGGLLFIRSSSDSPMSGNAGPCMTRFPATGS